MKKVGKSAILFELKTMVKIIKMNSKPIAVGLVFGVGMALTLDNWLLGIMFGIIFYVTLNEKEKREVSSSEEEYPYILGVFCF